MPNDSNLDSGKLWSAFGIGISVPNNGSYYIGVIINDIPIKWSSTKFQSQGDDLISSIYEAQPWTLGTDAVLENRNRISDPLNPAPSFSITLDVTPGNDLDLVTPISRNAFRSSNNNFVDQALDTEDSKWILKRNTSYIVRLENGDSTAAVFDFAVVMEEMIWSKK